jgi:cell wall-associated NlpC family hydrolase
MPTALRSRLPLLAIAASVLACAATLLAGDIGSAQALRAPIRLAPAKPGHPEPFPSRAPRAKRTRGERAVRVALKAVGVPYRYGGSSPSTGFDCSGLVYWAYKHVGVAVPHSSYALAGMGRRIGRAHLRPGDLLFFSGLGHVGLYVGRGRMVHAPHTGLRVQVVRLRGSGYGRTLETARRLG